MGPAKTAEPVEMRFGLQTRVGPRNHVLDGGPDSPMGKSNYEGERGGPLQSIANTVHVRWRCGLLSNYFDHLLRYVFTAWYKGGVRSGCRAV